MMVMISSDLRGTIGGRRKVGNVFRGRRSALVGGGFVRGRGTGIAGFRRTASGGRRVASVVVVPRLLGSRRRRRRKASSRLFGSGWLHDQGRRRGRMRTLLASDHSGSCGSRRSLLVRTILAAAVAASCRRLSLGEDER